MMKHCERSGKRLSAQIPYRVKKSDLELSDENETLMNDKRADWIEYIDDIKSEVHMKNHIQENLIEEDVEDEALEEEYEIHEENVILSDSPIKISQSLSLNDQLILAKIKLMQTQTELANREIRFVDEKTKYIQKRMRGCKCQELLQIL